MNTPKSDLMDATQRDNPANSTLTETSSPTNPSKPSTMRIDHRTDRSVLMAIMHFCLRPFGPKITKMTCEHPPGSPQLHVPKHATARCNVKERKVNDVYIYDMTANSLHMPLPTTHHPTEKTKRKRIYYFAGGGWRMPASPDHWALTSKFVAQLPDTQLSLISYPLAPKSPAADSLPILLNLLPTLFAEAAAANETIILAGDSAGANLALALPMEMLRAAAEKQNQDPSAPVSPPPMPAHILVIGPSVDLRRCNPEIPTIERRDPLLRHKFIKATSDTWRADWPPEDTRLSPLLHEDHIFTALRNRGVQVHGITGGYDILTPDGLLFRDRLVKAGVGGSWLHWEKQMHVFPLAWRYMLRESQEAKDWAVETIRKM